MGFLYIKSAVGVLAIVYIVAAFFLLFQVNALKRANRASKRWISTRRITKALDVMRDVDDNLFKISKILGVMSLVLAVVMIYIYIKFFNI